LRRKRSSATNAPPTPEEVDALLERALPAVADLSHEQMYPAPRDEIFMCGTAFAAELGLEPTSDPSREVAGATVEIGYAARRFEETLFASEPPSSTLLTFLLTGHAYGDPALSAWDLLHREATAFAMGLSTEATGKLSYYMLSGLSPGLRAKLAARTASVGAKAFNGGDLPPTMTAQQLLQCWEYGFVLRYAEMSLPQLSFVDYGAFEPRVPAADLSNPPPGIPP
jgi:hypothetical protein